jgi:NAD(P)-dependent dehydrogenase (short-subunit alcohol dehydrogenase family)
MVRQGYSPYGSSKAFLEAASRSWAQELSDSGVTVNVLLPGGATDTDLLPPSKNKKGADGNLLSPSVMINPALWLASDGSDGITGGRFIARHWDDSDPLKARDDAIQQPKIM